MLSKPSSLAPFRNLDPCVCAGAAHGQFGHPIRNPFAPSECHEVRLWNKALSCHAFARLEHHLIGLMLLMPSLKDGTIGDHWLYNILIWLWFVQIVEYVQITAFSLRHWLTAKPFSSLWLAVHQLPLGSIPVLASIEIRWAHSAHHACVQSTESSTNSDATLTRTRRRKDPAFVGTICIHFLLFSCRYVNDIVITIIFKPVSSLSNCPPASKLLW